ncbi:MAG: serine/threonine-protein kinase [Planctomycetota bacterium]
MISQNPDQELLVAVLANRWGFVSIERLRTVLSEDHEQEVPLAKRMVDANLLSTERARLIKAVAEELVDVHGSVESSLRVAGVEPQLSSILELAGQPDVETEGDEQTTFRSADQKTGSSDNGGSGVVSSDGARYEVQRFLARGGIGQVSVAIDKELNREVAFKEIRPDRVVDSSSRNRFLVEAEVTGRLEHPGIVPIYSLGTGDDGQPFYAMRFIRGESLTEAINNSREAQTSADDATSAQLQLRKLLSSFVSVCNTLHYAHDRGVVHRDIKPDNIMIGSFGETLVVDWGIAKTGTSNSDTADVDQQIEDVDRAIVPELVARNRTQQGAVMGTPGYMPPEQLLGWQDKVNCRSDVYSLGGTLYAILTGKNPFFDSDFQSLTVNVLDGKLKSPRAVDPEVPPALSAIAMKAMSKKAGARYESAKALASDIESWLADEPVSAYADPWTQKLRRWLRRHPAIASGTLATVALTLIGLVTGLAVVGSFNRQLDSTNDRLTESNKRGVAERTRAESNLAVAEEAVEKYLFEVASDPNLATPATYELRSRLLSTAIPFYEKFAGQVEDEDRILTRSAEANYRLADIYLNVSEQELAIEKCRTAIEQIELGNREEEGSQERRSAEKNETQILLADCWRVIAAAQAGLGRHKEAVSSGETAIELYSRIEQGSSDEEFLETLRRKRGIVLGNVAAFYFLFGDMDSAADYMEQSNELINIVDDRPDLKYLRAGNLNNLGAIANEQGEWRKAWENLDASVKILGELVGAYPQSTRYREQLGAALHNVARTFVGSENDRDALLNFEAALVHQRWLKQSYPSVGNYSSSLADTLIDLGNYQHRNGNQDEALASYTESKELLQGLVDEYPEVSQYLGRYGLACNNLGMICNEEDRFEEAMAFYTEAMNAFGRLLEIQPDSPRYQREFALASLNIGLNYQTQNDNANALEWFEKSAAAAGAFAHLDAPDFVFYRMHLNYSYAQTFDDLGRSDEAADCWALAFEYCSDSMQRHMFQMNQAGSLAASGRIDELLGVCDQLLDFENANSETCFRVALNLARGASADGVEKEKSQELVTRCVEALLEARDFGHFETEENRNRLVNEPAFEVFGENEDLMAFIESLDE